MYSRMLQKFPLITKMITSGTLFCISDVISQNFIEKKQQFDWNRNRNFITAGTFYMAPCYHFWYVKYIPALIKQFTLTTASKLTKAFTGMLIDQIFFCPINIIGFFIFQGFLRTLSIEGLRTGFRSSKQKLYQTLTNSYKIWPIVTMIIFMYIPIQYRVLFSNFVGLFWDMYMSYITYK